MSLLWGGRLAFYLWRRAAHGPDDPRYAALKKEWGEAAGRQLFIFLQVQAAAALPLALAAYFAASAPRAGIGPQDILGLAIFIAALAGETIADRQMAAFKADPANKGRVCDSGLWAWSRHPNYFFEWLVWWTWPLIAGLCLLMLDGGQLARVCGIALLAFWIVAAEIALRCPWLPTRGDLWYCRWRFVPCLATAMWFAS